MKRYCSHIGGVMWARVLSALFCVSTMACSQAPVASDARIIDRLVSGWPVLHEWDTPEPLSRAVLGIAYETLVSRGADLRGLGRRTCVLSGLVFKGFVPEMEPPTALPGLSEDVPYGYGVVPLSGLGAGVDSAGLMRVGDIVALEPDQRANGSGIVFRPLAVRPNDDGLVSVKAGALAVLIACRERLFLVWLRDGTYRDGELYRAGAVINVIDRRQVVEWNRLGSRDAVVRRVARAPSRSGVEQGLLTAGIDPVEALWWWMSAAGVVCEDGSSNAVCVSKELSVEVGPRDVGPHLRVVRGSRCVEVRAEQCFIEQDAMGVLQRMILSPAGVAIVVDVKSSTVQHWMLE